MTVFGYTRVSTVQQANEGDSLEAQIKQVTSYAASRGLELTESDVFVERGVSGGSEFANRPEGSRLLEVIGSGDMLIFPKLDRGFRNIRDALNTLHLFKERGVVVCCLDLGGEISGSGVGSILFAVVTRGVKLSQFARSKTEPLFRKVGSFCARSECYTRKSGWKFMFSRPRGSLSDR